MQKQAYLLDRCGADFGLQFTYHHYGPYSCDLAAGCNYALAEGQIEIEEKPGRHGVLYAIFRFRKEAEQPKHPGKLYADTARSLLQRMEEASDIILELAATIVFLRDEWDYYEKEEIGPVEETKVRKPLKATGERIDKALDLLRDLDLWKGISPT